jgi:ribosome biogenesis protein Nip4
MIKMDELLLFRKFCSQFTSEEIDAVRTGRNHFLAGRKLLDMRGSIHHDVFSLGLFLGEDKGRFFPSPALIDIISRYDDAASKKIFVNDKAAWLFLCGRNVLEESIAKNPFSIREGHVLVQNLNDENLGCGIFRQEGKELVIRNILDKGRYLRVDRKK